MAVMSTPYFSVIIPAYNRADPLAAAIGSVLAQTCQDFEIVVVDDGSKDDPKTVIEAFGDPRIRFIRQENQGGGAAAMAVLRATPPSRRRVAAISHHSIPTMSFCPIICKP